MDATTIICILLIWSVAGLIAAIVFGKATGPRDEGDES